MSNTPVVQNKVLSQPHLTLSSSVPIMYPPTTVSVSTPFVPPPASSVVSPTAPQYLPYTTPIHPSTLLNTIAASVHSSVAPTYSQCAAGSPLGVPNYGPTAPLFETNPPTQGTTYVPPTPQHNALGAPGAEMAMKVMSKHLLQTEFLKEATMTFDGNPMNFWPWTGEINEYIAQLELNPRQTLQYIASSCEGEPRKFLNSKRAALTCPTTNDVHAVMQELIRRYGSSQKVTACLKKAIDDFPTIKGYDICMIFVVLFN